MPASVASSDDGEVSLVTQRKAVKSSPLRSSTTSSLTSISCKLMVRYLRAFVGRRAHIDLFIGIGAAEIAKLKLNGFHTVGVIESSSWRKSDIVIDSLI